MRTFPQELIDHVLDYLHTDKPALSACSTVCSAFLPGASFHLFASLTVRLLSPFREDAVNEDEECEIRPLVELLKHCRRIARNVRALRVECHDFVSPTRPLDVALLRSLLRPLVKLDEVVLHGLSLYTPESQSDYAQDRDAFAVSKLEIEGSRLSWASLSQLLHAFARVDHLSFVRVLSVDDLAPLPPSIPPSTDIRSISFSACSRAQLSALVTPLEMVCRRRPSIVGFSNVLLDDMHAIDEVVDAFGGAIEHLYLDLPDRWFSWDPPETNIERLSTHITLPSFARLSALRTLHITVPIKMSPAAMHANRFLWTRLMDVLLSLPSSSSSSFSSPFSSSTSRSSSPLDPPEPAIEHAGLERIHIAFGNPRWTALAEVPYVLGVVAALDWEAMDAVVGRHWPLSLSLSSRSNSPSSSHSTAKSSSSASHPVPIPIPIAKSGEHPVSISKSGETRLELSIAARPTSRAQVERAVLGHVSARVKGVLGFVRGG